METHEPSRNRSRKEADSNMDSRGSRADDEEDREGSDKRKHKSSKSRKHADSEEIEEHDSGRWKDSEARNDARKKSGVSSRAGSGDENDYDPKRESHSKVHRKSVDDRVEKRSTDDYGDRDLEGSRKRRDDENDWDSSMKSSSRPSLPESSQNKPRSKSESEDDLGRSHDKESRFSDKKDINKEKRDQGQHDQERSSQHRRWDEVDRRKSEESSYRDRSDTKIGKVSDSNKHASSRDRDQDFKSESGENKSRPGEASGEKSNRPSKRDDRREDGDRTRIHSRLATPDDDSLVNRASREVRLDSVKDDGQKMAKEQSPDLVADLEQNAQRHSSKSRGDKDEKQREQRDSTQRNQDEFEISEKPLDEDSHSRLWDRSDGDARRSKRSRSPEKIGRNHREYDEHDRGFQDSDNEKSERSNSNKVKDREKEGYKNDRSSKGKDTNWADRTRDRDSSKEQWRRSQPRQDSKEGEEFDHSMESDVKRRDHARLGSENFHARSAYRKDARLRPDGARVSSTFANRYDNSDSIEIRPNKDLDFGREESTAFTGRKAEIGPQQEFTSGGSDEEWGCPPHDRNKLTHVDDFQERYLDDGSPMEQNSDRNLLDSQVNKGKMQKMDVGSNHAGGFSNINFQPSFGNNHGPGSYNRSHQQGPKGSRHNIRGPRGRMPGRDAQRVGLPPPLIGPPFGHICLPSGQLQPIGPNMNHSPGAPIGPGVFIPPFGAPLSWPGARAVDMNMLAAPSNFPHIPPPGPKGPRFPPTALTGSSHMYFNQPGAARGALPNTSSPGLSSLGPVGREMSHDKAPGGWVPPARNNGPAGKAPSRGEQNDYSQNFVDSGMRPQNFIRELELTNVVEDYPKLRELIQRKDEIVAKSASPPMYYKCDLREFALSPEFFGTKFDVILVDPPWEEYVHRAPGITDHLEYWTFEEIMNLKIEAIADTPSFIFLWVGDAVGLEQGRQCLKKWGFRRCEDICWIKTNKKNAAPGLRHDSHTVLQHSKEHCLMGIKGTVRRSTDGHIIHANIDTDIIIAEEPSHGSTKKPEDMYRIIEHFALGRRRLELFGEDHNIRSGWLTLGKELSSSNFNAEAYERSFADKDGKVWQGGGGRNPPPDAPHLVVTTPEIESLRPKSPPAKNHQQQQSTPLLMSSSSNNNRRASGNSPHNNMLNMDPSDSEPAILPPWASSPLMGFRGPDTGLPGSSDAFDNYGLNAFAQTMGDHMDFDPHHRAANML